MGKGGTVIVGSKATAITGTHAGVPRIIPETKMKEYKRPPKTIERIPEGKNGHEKDWIQACKGGKPASSNFDYSGPLTEMILMGNLAVRYPQRRLIWDGAKMEMTNDQEANSYVRRQYRDGWSLKQ